jgi:hypothetical protein
MEENAKEHRHSFYQPFFAYTSKRGRATYTLNIPKLMFVLCLLMLVLVYLNITLACLTNFNCATFLPTLAYLGCFRGHDRLFIVSCTYFALVLSLLYLGAYCHFRHIASDTQRYAMLILGLSSCAILPIMALVDEVNSAHVIPLEPIFSFLSVTFVLVNIAWATLAFLSIRKMQSSLNIHERRWYRVLQVIVTLTVSLAILDIIEWNYAYSIYTNFLLNENAEAVCEWALVTLGIISPAIFSQFYRGYVLTFSVKVSTKEELELSTVTLP